MSEPNASSFNKALLARTEVSVKASCLFEAGDHVCIASGILRTMIAPGNRIDTMRADLASLLGQITMQAELIYHDADRTLHLTAQGLGNRKDILAQTQSLKARRTRLAAVVANYLSLAQSVAEGGQE